MMIQTWLPSVLPVLAVALALGALALAGWSARRVRGLSRELGSLARSMDSALANLPRRDYVAREELEQRLAMEFDSLKHRMASTEGSAMSSGTSPATGSNAATLPSARLRGSDRQTDEPAMHREIARSLAAAIAEDRLEISLQPIVSISRGETLAFDVFASVRLGADEHVDISRVETDGTLDGADFEQVMLLSAVDTARRRLGSMSERMKLHVAISEALLSRPRAVAGIREILSVHPAIARSVVLSLPARILGQDQMTETVRALSDAGLEIAIEGETGWPEHVTRTPPISFLKQEAGRLLGPARASGGADFTRLPEWLARTTDIQVVATNVTSDEEAGELVDLGIDLMSGKRFSAPRRLAATLSRHGVEEAPA